MEYAVHATATTVRLRDPVHATLRAIARQERRPMNAVLEDAIECYRRQRFLDQVNAGYAALAEDERADLRREVEQFDNTLLDGLWASEAKAREYAPEKSTERARRR